MDYRIGITRVPELSNLFRTELLFIDLPGLDVTILDNFSRGRLTNLTEVAHDIHNKSIIIPMHPLQDSRSFPRDNSTRYLKDITKDQKSYWTSRHPNPDNPGCRVFLDLTTFRNSKGYTHRTITRQRKRLSRKSISECCIIGSIALIDNTMSLEIKHPRYIWLKDREVGSICKLLFELYHEDNEIMDSKK